MPIEKAPATARVKIAKFAMNLFFITCLFRNSPCIYLNPRAVGLIRYCTKQVPCQKRSGGKISNSFVFKEEADVFWVVGTLDSEPGGRSQPKWWFSPNRSYPSFSPS